jgi:hypothetical protein
VRITDAGTGVDFVQAVVGHRDPRAVLRMVNGRLVEGTRQDGVWEMATTLPAGATVGEWFMLSLLSYDRGGQSVSYNDREDGTFQVDGGSTTVPNPFGAFTVTGTVSDTVPPTIGWASIAFGTPSTVSNDADRPVTVRVPLQDDVTGVPEYANYVTLRGPGAAMIYLSGRRVSGTGTDGVWEYSGVLPKHAAAGEWRLATVTIADRGGRESVNQMAWDGSGVWDMGGPGDLAGQLPVLTVQETQQGPGHS